MRDFGNSDDPRVQRQLDRLSALSLATGRVDLATITQLMERLGNPQDRLPPVFHVAGTNGKGSVCAFLRAILEADGKRVHVTTSPHLVRYNERIRVAGELISDERLAIVLEEVFDACEGLSPSFFEITIAAAFLEFSRVPADACVVEVGLGGRLDATNILKADVLATCGIAALGIDHERFLLAPEDGAPTEPMARIAWEKAGIAKEGVPLVTMGALHPTECREQIRKCARQSGAELVEMEELDIPETLGLKGAHQAQNAALAAAMLRHQSALIIDENSIRMGLTQVQWPARMQALAQGPLTAHVPRASIILDGGHNANAARAIAAHFKAHDIKNIHAVMGVLKAKDAQTMLDELAPYIAEFTAVPVSEHDHYAPVELAAAAKVAGVAQVHTAPTVEAAVAAIGQAELERPGSYYPSFGGTILIAGSLYLAGEVLKANDEVPD